MSLLPSCPLKAMLHRQVLVMWSITPSLATLQTGIAGRPTNVWQLSPGSAKVVSSGRTRSPAHQNVGRSGSCSHCQAKHEDAVMPLQLTRSLHSSTRTVVSIPHSGCSCVSRAQCPLSLEGPGPVTSPRCASKAPPPPRLKHTMPMLLIRTPEGSSAAASVYRHDVQTGFGSSDGAPQASKPCCSWAIGWCQLAARMLAGRGC